MPAKPSERQYRSLAVPLNVRAADGATKKRFDTEYYVEGYASTFNDPYVLFEDFDGTKYIEVISPDAFREADMSDVILQFDHAGRVYARMSNGTLGVGAVIGLVLIDKTLKLVKQVIHSHFVHCSKPFCSWRLPVSPSQRQGHSYGAQAPCATAQSLR